MRWTQTQLDQYLNRAKQADETIKEAKSEQDKKERAKFRQHVRKGNYQFCDSFFLEE